MGDYPEARVVVRDDGSLVLEDPQAEGVLRAVQNHNHSLAVSECERYFRLHEERLQAFASRVLLRESQDRDVVVCISADDPKDALMLDVAMPGHDWDEYRKRGEVPFGRGILPRDAVLSMCAQLFDEREFSELRKPLRERCQVLIVACGVVVVLEIAAEEG